MINLLSFVSVMKNIGAVLLAVAILLVMVTVHEFGHYAAGKILKFKVNEFSIGFGPALFKKKNESSDEQFSVRLLPLGGYCAFAGEDDDNADQDNPYLFSNRAPWKRIVVLFAGPLMNYLLALLLVFGLFFGFGQYEYQVYSVAEEPSVPAEYCLKEGDIVTKIEGKNTYVLTDYISAINGKKQGDLVEVSLIREGESATVKIMLQADADFVNLSDTNTLLYAIGVTSMGGVPVRFGFFSMIGRSFAYSFRIGGTILQTLGELLTGKLALTAVGGPITTIKITSQVASQSVQSFLEIAAYIGVNLAVFNLLPIPALDGSKIILTAIEWIRKKPLNRKVEAVINVVGFVAIFGFAILVDILQFI